MAPDAVKIYFCDICNESIPLKDLEMGTAITIKGKVICYRCNPQNGASKAVPLVSGSSSGAPVHSYAHGSHFGMTGIVAVFALLVGGTAIALIMIDRDTNNKKFQIALEATHDLKDKISDAEKLIAAIKLQMQADLDRWDKKVVSSLKGEIEKEASAAENRTALLKEKIDFLQESLRQADTLRTRLDQGEAWRVATDQKLSAIKADLEGFLEEIRTVKEAAAKNAAAIQQANTAAGPAGPGVPTLPGWDDILKRLKDPDPGVRWNAVIDLGQTGDPRAVPHLLPLLKDEDVFVRNNTALTLGELDAKSAVGELIETLTDSEQVVRDSAYTVLKRITKQSLKFDPFSTRKEDREKGVNAWRDWWNANKNKFLGNA